MVEITSHTITSRIQICPVCNQEVSFRLSVGLISPKWTHNSSILYFWWRMWTKYVRRIPLSIMCHDECIPPGYKKWEIIMAPDIEAYHSPKAEEELMQLLAEEIKND